MLYTIFMHIIYKYSGKSFEAQLCADLMPSPKCMAAAGAAGGPENISINCFCLLLSLICPAFIS